MILRALFPFSSARSKVSRAEESRSNRGSGFSDRPGLSTSSCQPLFFGAILLDPEIAEDRPPAVLVRVGLAPLDHPAEQFEGGVVEGHGIFTGSPVEQYHGGDCRPSRTRISQVMSMILRYIALTPQYLSWESSTAFFSFSGSRFSPTNS